MNLMSKEKIFSVAMSVVGLIFCIVGFACTVTTNYIGSVTILPLPLIATGLIFGLIGIAFAGAIGSKRRWTVGTGISFGIGIAAVVGNLYLLFTAIKVVMYMASSMDF